MKLYLENNEVLPGVVVLDDNAIPPGNPGDFLEITDITDTEHHGNLSIEKGIKSWSDKKHLRDKLKTLIYTLLSCSMVLDMILEILIGGVKD